MIYEHDCDIRNSQSMWRDFSLSNAFVRVAGFLFCFKEAAYFLLFTDNNSEYSVVSSIEIFLH